MILAACMALCSSCEKDKDTLSVSLSITPTSVQFAAGETSTKTATVTTKATWYASPSASWLSLEQDGNRLSITPRNLNNDVEERTAIVAVSAGNAEPVQIAVTQAVTQVSLSASPTTVTFGASETAAKTVTVTSSAQIWSVYTPDTWITCDQDGNKLLITATANSGSSQRSATVAVRAGNATPINITVTQSGRTTANNTLSVSPTSITFGATETATKTATVTTNAAGWNSSSTASWLSLSQQGNTLRITPTGSNTSTSQRSATITVTAGNANPVTVQVTQSGTSGSSSLNFNDIVNSTYSATGTPATGVSNPAPRSWTGNLYTYPTDSYYAITNWANLANYPLWVDYANGKLYLDFSSVVRSTDDIDYYYVVGYLEGNTFTSMTASYKYEVTYNKTTRTLDFSGTVDGRTASVALAGVNKKTQQGTVYTNTILSGAKFVLTTTRSSSETRSTPSSGKPGKAVKTSAENLPTKYTLSSKALAY